MTTGFTERVRVDALPRLPLRGILDLTYRCNNNCRHCWLSIPATTAEPELSLDEIRRIADEARALGCREWSISGGEPMLRADFSEVFDYLTRTSPGYHLNTNGTLVTPAIASLLKRKGTKMVALYGATKATYDRITRHPGGFEKVMQGFRYLNEAGAGFIVQLVPMRDNWHEWGKMKDLAQSLSRHWRVASPWLHLSCDRDPVRNAEICRQRLAPEDVVELERPDLTYEEATAQDNEHMEGDDRLFAHCSVGRRDFHVDPYGGMTFCSLLKDRAMRYDLRKGSVREAWERFVPSLADKVHGGPEYARHCGSCDKRSDCRWCPAYGWLEHGRFSAPVEYLCEIAAANRRYKDEWRAHHRRYFRIAGITIQVDSDLPIDDQTFHPKFAAFRTEGAGADTVTIRHHFALPDLKGKDLGRELYRRPPWAIFQQNGSWTYLGISPEGDDLPRDRVAVFNAAHTRGRIYNDGEETWRKGDLPSLTTFPTDQILIARLLAERSGCYLHSAAAILNGAGMLFVGHSGAGKSTITRLLLQHCHSDHGEESPVLADLTLRVAQRDRPEVEILCDDRNIVRKWSPSHATTHGAEERIPSPLTVTGEARGRAAWRVHGTWSHGEIPLVSANEAPLGAICFLEKANENTLTPLCDHKEIMRRLLACVVKPFVTADWWDRTLGLIWELSNDMPSYVMRFDKTGAIVEELASLGMQAKDKRHSPRACNG